MTKVKKPVARYSKWHIWEEREEIAECDMPGVYLIAESSKNLDGQHADPSFGDIIYIGMTVSKGGLKSRWRQFARAAKGKGGHSGGKSLFAKNQSREVNWNNIYIAALPVQCDTNKPKPEDFIKMGWLAYLEYAAFSRFNRKKGELPECNKKHK